MEQNAQEARDLALQQSQALEQMVAAVELRLKSDMTNVEQKVDDLKLDFIFPSF